MIANNPTNISIHYLLSNLSFQTNTRVYDMLCNIISKHQQIHSTIFSLINNSRLINISGIDSIDLNSGFSLHFMINLDSELLDRVNTKL